MPLSVYIIPAYTDNYIYLLANESGECVIIDAGEAPPVLAALQQHTLTPKAIWLTHHHWDHVDGAEELAKKFDIPVVGFAGDAHRVPFITQPLHDGESFQWSGHEVRVRHIAGHTLGHIYFYVPQAGIAFVGDTLFAMGCGRLFEGDAASLYDSLQIITHLPPQTQLYCGHEYTEANARFAHAMEPTNANVQTRQKEVLALRAAGKPTMPTTVHLEMLTNPFLRSMSLEIRATLGLNDNTSELEVFAALRRTKDSWKG